MARLLDESLPAAELAELDAHVEWCRACQGTLNALTQDPFIRSRPPADATRSVAVPALAPVEAWKEMSASLSAATPGPGSQSNTAIDVAAVLSPAQGPGELGRLGHYRVLKVLGQGGMGIVFEAEDVHLGRLVALKVVRPEAMTAPDAKPRFLREARACAALKHDHVITIYQVGEERGVPYMATELLEGMSLDDWLDSCRTLTLAQILRIGRETAQGLAAAHAKGLLHRDIKPANLWLDKNSGRVKILDFGLARSQQEDSSLTQQGYVLGTPSHMAPEQAGGEKLDQRCDLFSLGVVLYRLCTGQLPFRGETTLAALTSLAVDTPQAVSALNSEVPVELSELIARLLAKKPEDRPASAGAVVEALQALERGRSPIAAALPVAVPVAVPAEELTEPLRQRPTPWSFTELSQPCPGGTPQPLVQMPTSQGRRGMSKRNSVLVGLAASLLTGALLAGIIIIIRNKDGSETRIEVPDGAGVEVLKDGKRVAKVGPADAAEQLAVVKWLMEKKKVRHLIGIEKDGQVVKEKALPPLPFKVRTLNLEPPSGAPLFTPEELQRLRVLVDLEVLALSGQPVMDETLAHLAPLCRLRDLTLDTSRLNPAAAVQTLQRFPKLERLQVRAGSDEWLQALARLPELRALTLYQWEIPDKSMRWVKDYPRLTHLGILNCQFNEAGLLQLKEAKLQSLVVSGSEVPKETFERLAQAMPGCEIHDKTAGKSVIYNKGKAGPTEQLAVVKWLMEEKGLREIEVEQNGQTVKSRKPPSLPFIVRKLDLNIHNVKELTAEEIVRVTALVDLQELSLGGQPVTDEVLARLVSLTELRMLSLVHPKITPASVETLRRFPKLEYLPGMFASESWVKALAQLPTLRRLGFYKTHVTDRTMQLFKDCPNLTQLDFHETTFSKEALFQLKEARQLRLLVIRNQNAIEKAIFERLAETIPWCEIHDRTGGGKDPMIYNKGKADGIRSDEP